MGVIEEEPSDIQSGSTRKRSSRDKEKPHLQEEEEEPKKKKIIGKSEIIMSLTDLPSNVLVEILARLPLRTLFVARSVCKTFISLTTPNPHFINVHSSNAVHILVFQFGTYNGHSCLLRMADHEFDCKNSQLEPPLFQLPETANYFLVNSCNGLLYLRRNSPHDYGSLVCNPVTSEYILIPHVVFDPKMLLDVNLWLGFSPGTGQYKVIGIFPRKNGNPNEAAAQVYVIGSDSWRDIDDTPPRRQDQFFGQTLINGLMYWHYRFLPNVISFDLDKEKFGEVALPAEFQGEEFTEKYKYETSIGVLGDCLCLSCNDTFAHRVDLWVMRNFGNRESWTKDFVVDTAVGPRGGPFFDSFKPLQFLRNGEILMLWMRHTLVCYDPRTGSLRYFRLHRRGDLGHKAVAVALTPSFVPLKDALKVDKVLSQSRPREDEKKL